MEERIKERIKMCISSDCELQWNTNDQSRDCSNDGNNEYAIGEVDAWGRVEGEERNEEFKGIWEWCIPRGWGDKRRNDVVKRWSSQKMM